MFDGNRYGRQTGAAGVELKKTMFIRDFQLFIFP